MRVDTKDSLPIGQFAQATGLSVTTLRHYDAVGVLVPASTDPVTGYRHYARDQVEFAQLVRALRQLDIPVDDIRTLLARHRRGGSDITPDLAHYVETAEQRVATQRVILRALTTRLTEGAPMSQQITVRHRPATRALAYRGSLNATQFMSFADNAFQTLYTVAGKGPLTLLGPAVVQFHGPLTEDAETEVEACLPYWEEGAQPGELPAGVAVLHLDECDFAGTVVAGPEAAYPRILTAYDTVAAWISAHGFTFAGPAQEIYHRWTGVPGAPGNRLEVGFAVRDAAG